MDHLRILLICPIVFACSGVIAQPPPPSTPPAAVPGGDALNLSEYYGDSVSRIGSFPGRLVCISTQQAFVPENATSCGPEHVYALAMDKPAGLVPLFAGTDTSPPSLEMFLDKSVVVRGKHYPDKGMIAVAAVESTHTAADGHGDSGSP